MTDTMPYAHLGEALATDYLLVREQFSDEQWDALHRHAPLRRPGGAAGHQRLLGARRAALAADHAARRARAVGEDIEGYGCPGMTPLPRGLVNMELHRGDGSLGTFLGVQSGLAMKSIAMLGSEEQKAALAGADGAAGADRRLRADRTRPRLGLRRARHQRAPRRRRLRASTAPSAGSATPRSPTSSSSGRAREDDGQVKGFLVATDTPGYRRDASIEGKGATRAIWQADIRFDGVRVPAENRLPEAHSFKDAGRVLTTTREHHRVGRARPRRGRLRRRVDLHQAADASSGARCAASRSSRTGW